MYIIAIEVHQFPLNDKRTNLETAIYFVMYENKCLANACLRTLGIKCQNASTKTRNLFTGFSHYVFVDRKKASKCW